MQWRCALLCSTQANMAKALACQHKYPTYTETFNDFEFSLHVSKRGAIIQCKWRQQHQTEPNWAKPNRTKPNRSKPPENKKCCACICRNITISKYIYGSPSKSLWLFYRLWLIHFRCSTICPFPFTKFWFLPLLLLLNSLVHFQLNVPACAPSYFPFNRSQNDDFSILLSFYAFCYYFSGSDYVWNFFFLYNYSFLTVNILIFCVCSQWKCSTTNQFYFVTSAHLFIVFYCMPLNACLYRLAGWFVRSSSFTIRANVS